MLPNLVRSALRRTPVLTGMPAILQHHRKRNVNNKVQIFKTVTQKDVDDFANLTNDHNPIHKAIDANSTPIVHGALVNGLVAGVIGTHMPGPGTIVVSQSFSFPHKTVVDREIEINVEVTERRKIISVAYECKQNEKIVFVGTARLVSV